MTQTASLDQPATSDVTERIAWAVDGLAVELPSRIGGDAAGWGGTCLPRLSVPRR